MVGNFAFGPSRGRAAAVVPIPAAMDFVTAAAFPVAYGTSHLALTHRGHLQLSTLSLGDAAVTQYGFRRAR
jgi:NADPH:quinone reductase-like Zn-dependent oxidoreductase